MKLLLIEDDTKLAEHLVSNLREHGFFVTHLPDQSSLESALEVSSRYDVVVLDRLLGTFDSKVLLPKIRERWPQAPVLVLSAISTPNERTDLINLGADDYMSKPFSTQELVARLRATLRRTAAPTTAYATNYASIGNMIVDSVKRIISVGDATTSLPAKEFLLLRTLTQEPGRVWSKNELLDYVWGQASNVETNVVEATIANLRKKLTEVGANASIRNMRNAGYWVEE